ncbi:MAG: hypothetical protein LBM70_04790 [Victivallales bacterium]|nr:hypothetical protein [Victivallales bacterium]
MKKIFAFACFGLIYALGSSIAAAGEGEVIADLLNIRTQPSIKAPVAVKLAKGFKVEVLGESGEFVEVAIPATAPVYISAVYLNENKTTSVLKMYVAGSIGAASYGSLPKGSEVKVLEIDRFGWAKIEPPAGLKLYAAKRYIKYAPVAKIEVKEEVKPKAEVVADVKEEVAVKPEVKPETVTVTPQTKPEVKEEAKPEAEHVPKPEVILVETVTITPEVKPVTPATEEKMSAATEKALREIGVDLAQGKAVTADGNLLKIDKTTVPLLQYALMKNNITHEYYVCADKVNLAGLGAVKMTFKGQAFRVPGWRVPILYVESVAAIK